MPWSSSCARERAARLAGLLAACALAWALAAVHAQGQEVERKEPAEPESLDALLTRLSRIEGLRGRYVEEKQIALLKQPLRSEGTIAFAAPGLLVRRAEKPEPATLLLDGEVLTVADASGQRRIDLSEHAVVRLFVLTFVNVLRGDRAALDRAYAMRFERTASGWTLELSPKPPELRRFITRARIEGHGVTVERMTLEEASGDVTRLDFSEIDPRARFDAAERARLFKLDASAKRPGAGR